MGSEYFYMPRGAMWYVFKRNGWSADKIEECMTKEEARKRVYELNGWAEK